MYKLFFREYQEPFPNNKEELKCKEAPKRFGFINIVRINERLSGTNRNSFMVGCWEGGEQYYSTKNGYLPNTYEFHYNYDENLSLVDLDYNQKFCET